MAEVRIEIAGRSHEVACRDGEEDRLRTLARLVDERAGQVIRSLGRGTEGRELLLAALLLADELDEAQAAARGLAAAAEAIDATADRIERLADRLAAAGSAS